ncbi:unnamed protein product, partial [Didymodactylos carnosus]
QNSIRDYQQSVTSLSQHERNITEDKSCTFIEFLQDSWTLIQALFVRMIFILSSIAAVWRVVRDTKDDRFWYLLLLLLFLVIESYVTVYGRKGYEYKWFCPSAFAYLITIVPCIWLLELHHSDHTSKSVYISLHSRNDSVSSSILLPFILQPSTEAPNLLFDQKITNNQLFLNNYNGVTISYDNSTSQSDFSQTSVNNIIEEDFMNNDDRRNVQIALGIEELLKTPQKFISK